MTAHAVAPIPLLQVVVVLLICKAEEEHYTIECIDSLLESDGVVLRTVLVNNGAPEDVLERIRARFPHIEVLEPRSNLGFTGGNNLGIRWALESRCEFVLVLNNDTVVEPACISRLVAVARTGARTGAVGGKILFYDDPTRIWFGGGRFSPTRGIGLHRYGCDEDAVPELAAVEEVTFLTGCCMLFPAGVLREVGGFEEDFFIYCEDVELSVRIAAAGYRLLYEPSARLMQRVPLHEPPIPAAKIVLRDRNRRRLMARRFGWTARARFALFFYPSRIAHGIRYLLQGDWRRLEAIWQGMTAR